MARSVTPQAFKATIVNPDGRIVHYAPYQYQALRCQEKAGRQITPPSPQASLSPKKCFAHVQGELKEDLEPDAEPMRQVSCLSNISEELQLELDEVKRQLSEAQEAAMEATARAQNAEDRIAKEAEEQRLRKLAARKLLEETQRKRRFQEAKQKAEALEGKKAPALLPRAASGTKRQALRSPSVKGVRGNTKRELSRQRQDAVIRAKEAAEKRKQEIRALLEQEEQERLSMGDSQEILAQRLHSSEEEKTALKVELAAVVAAKRCLEAHAERLAFEREDLICRLSAAPSTTRVIIKPSRKEGMRLRQTTAFTFVVIVGVMIFAYFRALHGMDFSSVGHTSQSKTRLHR